jgi:hypothetical protein
VSGFDTTQSATGTATGTAAAAARPPQVRVLAVGRCPASGALGGYTLVDASEVAVVSAGRAGSPPLDVRLAVIHGCPCASDPTVPCTCVVVTPSHGAIQLDPPVAVRLAIRRRCPTGADPSSSPDV